MEIELKLLLASDDLRMLAAHPRVVERVRVARRPVILHSIYFDTPDGRLRERGLALRLRRDRGRWIQTLKGPGEAVAGLHARGEFEWQVPGKALATDLLAETPFEKLFAKRRLRAALAPAFVTEFRRRVIELGFPDGTQAALCLDAGEIRAGSRTEPISEAEIELIKGAPRTLIEFAIELSKSVSFRLGHASKSERAWRLALGAPQAPRHATQVALDAGASPVQAVTRIVSSCLAHIGANSEGTIAGRDIEFLHQFRVGVRRLRVALALLRDERWRNALEPEKRELKRLSIVLGAARNRDVFVSEILPPIARHFGQQRMAGLLALGTAQQRRHGKAVQQAIASRRFTSLCLRLAALLAESQPAEVSPAPSAPTRPAQDPMSAADLRRFAAHTLERRKRKLLEIAPGGARPTPKALHALRIEAKKLRYTAEFFASLYPAKKLARHIAALTSLQNVLGAVNDAAVAQSLIQQAGRSVARAPAPGMYALAQGWIAASEARGREDYAAAWKHFQQAKSFW